MKALLIVNPKSGTSAASKDSIVELARRILPDAGFELEVVYTERRGHASELASAAADSGVPVVIAAGGDGTVNETARALCYRETSLGIIPCGSGNGLARHLNLSMNPERALRTIAAGRVETIDFCTANGEPFFCTFGMGFDAAVSDRFASRPDRRGLRNYVRAAVEVFLRYKSQEYTLSTPEETLTERAFIVACCNASQYGNNAFIAPRASLTDGLMDVTVIHRGSWLSHALSGLQIMTGSLADSARVRFIRTSSLHISRPFAGPAHLDGEVARIGKEIDVKCNHKALRVFTPGEVRVRPLLTSLGIAK
ncbi:MAG: diacylglycerol kinase family lipid kinase [Muribaculaceae bacterium]|nr:diacylglycerol kinase family lipid kinase [Muribaculaceae bacterium]